MGWMKCSVPGCEDRTSPRHRFPIFDQQVYDEWLTRIGNDKLSHLHPLVVYYGRRVCGRHFSHYCKLPNSTKLKQRSLPTLYLPGFHDESTVDNSIIRLSKAVYHDEENPDDDEETTPSSAKKQQSSQVPPERNLSFQQIFDEIARDYDDTEMSATLETVDSVDLTALLNFDFTYLVNDTSVVPNEVAMSAALSSFDETLLAVDTESSFAPRGMPSQKPPPSIN